MLKTDLNNEMISDINYHFKIFDMLLTQHDQTLTVSRLCSQNQFNSVQECRETLKLYRENEEYGKFCELIYLVSITDDSGDNITMKVINETDLSLYTSKIYEKFVYGIKQKNININDSIANNQVHFHLECEEIRRNILAAKLLPNKLWISKYSLFRKFASPKLRYSYLSNQDYNMINNDLDISKTELYPVISNNNSKNNSTNTDPYPLSIYLEANIDNSSYTASNIRNDLDVDINITNIFNEDNKVYNFKDINFNDINFNDKKDVDIIMEESSSKISIDNNENLLFNNESNDNLGSNDSNNSNLISYSEKEINNDNSLEKKSSKRRKNKSSLFNENNNINNKKNIHYNKSKSFELSCELLNKKNKIDFENKLDDNNETSYKYDPQQVDAIKLEKITRDKIYKDSKTGYLVVEDDVDFILSKEKSTYMTKKQTITSNGHNKIIKSVNNTKKYPDTKQQTLTSFFKVCK
ncbi:hypothetical protein ACR3K2_36250 [Cryptosporidium serpentis]